VVALGTIASSVVAKRGALRRTREGLGVQV
jgi:hypothetical protein